MIELHDCVVGPELLPNLLSRGHLAAKLDQKSQYFERLFLKLDGFGAGTQFRGTQV